METSKLPSLDKPATTSLNSLYNAYTLFQNWRYMSPAQKAKGLAGLGIKAGSLASGKDLSQIKLIEGNGTTPPLNLGDAFSLFSQGFNAYSLAENWGQLNTIQRVLGGGQTALQIAQTADKLGLLGQGVAGADVALSADKLAAAGWQSYSSGGVGAISAPAGTVVPQGYRAVASTVTGEIMAVPVGTISSSAGAITGGTVAGSSAGGGLASSSSASTSSAAGSAGVSGLSTALGVVGVAGGAYTIASNWGTGGASGRTNAAIGGASIASGLMALGVGLGPFAIAGIIAASLLAGSVKTGKSQDQQERDAALKALKQGGFIGDDYKVDIGDGLFADLGLDGHYGKHKVTNADLLTKGHREEGRDQGDGLNYWDIDYTNDLDYFSGTTSTSFMRLLLGGKGKNIDQTAGKLGNAMLQDIGYGQEFTEDNFAKLRDRYRGVFSKKGITSKQDAYQLANEMYAQGRIDETDLVSMQHMFNAVYDNNGYEQAKNLMAGRHRGIEVADQDRNVEPILGKAPVLKPSSIEKLPPALGSLSNPPLEFKGIKPLDNKGNVASLNVTNGSLNTTDKNMGAYNPSKQPSLTADEIKKLNQSSFGNVAQASVGA